MFTRPSNSQVGSLPCDLISLTDVRKAIHFWFAHLLSCCKDGSDDFQALYVSELYLEVLSNRFILCTPTCFAKKREMKLREVKKCAQGHPADGGRAKILSSTPMVFKKLYQSQAFQRCLPYRPVSKFSMEFLVKSGLNHLT